MPNSKEKVFFGTLFGGIGLCALLAISPILSLLIGEVFTSQFGCTIDASGAHPCVVLGIDFGDFLAVGALAGFVLWASIPAGILLAGTFTVLMLIANWFFKFTATPDNKPTNTLVKIPPQVSKKRK